MRAASLLMRSPSLNSLSAASGDASHVIRVGLVENRKLKTCREDPGDKSHKGQSLRHFLLLLLDLQAGRDGYRD